MNVIDFRQTQTWVDTWFSNYGCDDSGMNCTGYNAGYWKTTTTPVGQCPSGFTFQQTGDNNWAGINGYDTYSCIKN
jgi:hypothetical protein